MIVNVTEYLDRSARDLPDKTAIIDGERRFTFREVQTLARRMATATIGRSVECGPVAVLLPKTGESIAAFLGALYAGCFYVPLDISSPSARIKKILDKLEPLLVVTTPELRAKLELETESDRVLAVDLQSFSKGLPEPEDAAIAKRVGTRIDTDPIYVMFTSGSTGKPKGVVLPQRAVIDYIEWAADTYRLDDSDVIANQAPFHFDVSVQDMYLSLKTGATLVIVPEEHFVAPGGLLEYIAGRKVSFFCWVPSVLVTVANLDLLRSADTSSLRWVTVLGEVMSTKHFKYWQTNCSGATLVNTYGPTETAIASTFYVMNREIADHDPLPIGSACRNTGILLIDEEGRLIRDGIGEICIRGSGLALGYWGDPEKTAAVFTPVPGAPYSERMYRTGDLGYWNERGELMFSGRMDSQIKHMGYRIELGEIESAASGIEALERACVLYNERKKAITLFYESSVELDMRKMRAQLAQQLPAYMVPKAYVRVESFPLTPNGKLDRKRVRELHFDG